MKGFLNTKTRALFKTRKRNIGGDLGQQRGSQCIGEVYLYADVARVFGGQAELKGMAAGKESKPLPQHELGKIK
jgi:hypothetical protein